MSTSVSTRPIKVAPAATDAIAPPNGGAVWTNGAWTEFIGSASVASCLVGLVVGASGVSGASAEIEVGVGTAGSEVPIAVLHVYQPDPGNGGPGLVMLPAPVSGITSGSRVAVRVRCSNTFATWPLALLYTESPDSDHITSASPTALPVTSVGVSVTPSATAWANSSWVELTTGLSSNIGVYGICLNQPVHGVDIEIDIGVGSAGSETVLTTLRKNTGQTSATGRVLFVHLPAIMPVASSTRVAVRMRKSGTSTTAHTMALLYYAGLSTSPSPVDYEDPCSITEPRIFATITTETETIKVGVHPLRDSAARGGFAEPRLLDVSPVTRVSSDVATGAWSAQTASMRWADTDRANRERSDVRTSFRNCHAAIYLTSNAQRHAGLPPRVLFAGTVYQDSADENLVLSQTINDLIGSNYSLFSDEKQIPQRVIEKNWFPHAPDGSLGQAEPIVGGRRAPLDPAALAAVPLPEGVSKGVYVGQVRINGAHGTPTGTDLASVVAALEASRAAGTLYTDYGSRIGYGDALVLQGYGSVPSDYDALAAVIGYGDLDALLAETANTGGDLFEAVVIASHAISEILAANNGHPSIWVGDTQVASADIGVSVWAPQIPGDASWAADIGADLFTDVIGADGVTRRYTLVLFDPASANGIAVAGGSVVHVDCGGIEDVGDGTGAALTDYFDLYRHVLVNFILQDYQSGAWLASPQFLFSDGTTLLDRVDSDSFDEAGAVAALTLTGGYLGSFTLDVRSSVRDIVANFNFSGGCLLAQDDFGRLIVKVLDTRRTNFLTGRYTGTVHRTLTDKRDILPGFRIDAKPDWQVNRLTYQYAKNNFTGSYERDAGGGGNTVFIEDTTSQARDGVVRKTVEFPYVRDDATAAAVANYYLALFKDLPRVVTYTRRGLCGLEDDVLDGVPVTHFNGYGSGGWTDHAVWIIGKIFDPTRMVCTFTALDIDARLVAEETVRLEGLTLDPVALEFLYSDDLGEPLTTDV